MDESSKETIDNDGYVHIENPKHIEGSTITPYVKFETKEQIQNFDVITNSNGDNDMHLPISNADDATSLLTIDCIADPTGFFIMCLITMTADIARGVMFPTLWPLMYSLGGTTVYQGYAVAAFSFGRIISSPILGSWSITIGYKKTLIIAVSILCVGTLCYAQVGNVGSPTFLIFAQALMGVGCGTLACTRSFVADITPTRNRTKYMSWLTAVQYGSFTITPLLGSFFAWIFENENNVIRWGLLVIDAYTLPAYFMFLLTIFTIFVLIYILKDRKSGPVSVKKKRQKLDEDDIGATYFYGICTIYEFALFGCMFLNSTTRGAISVFETMNVIIADEFFGLSFQDVGYTVGFCGIAGVISLLSMGQIGKIFTDIQMIMFGCVMIMLGCALFLDLEDEEKNQSGYDQSWRYSLTIFLVYSLGFPIGNTAVIGLFSKIVGRRPQGTLQGYFVSAGALARIIFPISSGYITDIFGLRPLLFVVLAILSVSIMLTLYSKRTFESLAQ